MSGRVLTAISGLLGPLWPPWRLRGPSRPAHLDAADVVGPDEIPTDPQIMFPVRALRHAAEREADA